MRIQAITPQFVDYIPERLGDGVLYISERYRTASHKCCCGCGEEVVTPISPADWSLRRDSELITLHPSIGNWNFACRSHYWIRRNRVEWARAMTEQQIARVQHKDKSDKASYIEEVNRFKEMSSPDAAMPRAPQRRPQQNLFNRIWGLFRRWSSRGKP